MKNSADPDQLASEEANWSGSTLFAKTGHVVFSKRRVKTQMNHDIICFKKKKKNMYALSLNYVFMQYHLYNVWDIRF